MQQTKWDPKPYQVGVKGSGDRESRHITSLEVWMFLDSHTWFDTPNQVNAMHVMQTWLNMQHDTKMQGTTSTMQLTWQMCNAKHARCKCGANINQFGNGISMLWGLMKQSCNLHETSMQWSLKVIKVRTLIHLKTAPRVLKMMDNNSC